jgi:nucleotide-binding universal stress UspA family protein
MIQRILCPTDLTADSKESVSYAFTLAERNGARLIVLHVTSFPVLWRYPCELDGRDRWQELVSQFKMDRILAEGQRKVRNFVAAGFTVESNSVTWKPRVAVGGVAEEIVTSALQEGADLIVMDRRQRPLLSRLLATGVLERVSRNAPCPVLLIDAANSIHRSGEWRMPLLEEVAQTF